MDDRRISQIKEWLRNDRKIHRCPFRYAPQTGQICMELFPNIITGEDLYMRNRACGIRHSCPCSVYSVSDVIAIAKEVVNGIRKDSSD
jgi:hypothetical protein